MTHNLCKTTASFRATAKMAPPCALAPSWPSLSPIAGVLNLGYIEFHIWTRPVLQDLADDILGKDCEHISGLEVEGRHPRALMESALLLLNRSSASKAQPR